MRALFSQISALQVMNSCYKSEWTKFTTNPVKMIMDFLIFKTVLFHTLWQNLIENGKIKEYLKFFRKSKTEDVEDEAIIFDRRALGQL